MPLTRRTFIRALGTAAAAGALSEPLMSSLVQRIPAAARTLRVTVFHDPAFPTADMRPVERGVLERATSGFNTVFASADTLASTLARGTDVLVTAHGSAFPVAQAREVFRWLQDGGNWVHLGGVPAAVPVLRTGAEWHVQERLTAWHRPLGITQTFPVDGLRVKSMRDTGLVAVDGDISKGITAKRIHELYVRFTTSKDMPSEDGSSGPRDAVLRPLVHALDADGRAVAAPVVLIDRMQGPFAGGRWVLAPIDGTFTADAVRRMISVAAVGAVEFSVRPTFACYRGDERPSIAVQVRRPQGKLAAALRDACTITVSDASGRVVERDERTLAGAGILASASAEGLRMKRALAPALYTVRARILLDVDGLDAPVELECANGFHMFDADALRGGAPLVPRGTMLTRDGAPFLVAGTTYMSSDAHRKFLLEPNPFLWNADMATMRASGVNLIRTGIWTAWKNIMLDPGAMDERALRALDAFLLTARAHDLPVIFTFFAFLPEAWGALNPFLDPRAVQAQKEFLTLIAVRYRDVPWIVWDLINEPSFSSPERLWSCRPNYDAYEQSAWSTWLRARYPAPDEAAFRAAMCERWHTTADDALGLPTSEEFDDRNIFYAHRSVRALDYRLFAQDMFSAWVREMRAALRDAGHPAQLVMVGQDEGGTADRPNPQFFAEDVDITCNHTWWLNDDLVWDVVTTAAPGRPHLVEETGVMFYEDMNSAPWRSEHDAALLLERKLALALGAGSTGAIQWLWNTNVYMNSDNEAAIGWLRADGTEKPELAVARGIHAFLAQAAAHCTDPLPPDVTMVIPHASMFSVRNTATAATKAAVRAMAYECGMPLAGVSEYTLTPPAGPRKGSLLLVPSPRVLSAAAWQTLLAHARAGATVLVTGPFDADEHWLDARRNDISGLDHHARPVAQTEVLLIGDQKFSVPFRGDKMHRIQTGWPADATIDTNAGPADSGIAKLVEITAGDGRIIWCPVSVELSDDPAATIALYRHALQVAAVSAPWHVDAHDSAVLVLPRLFAGTLLFTLVNESSADAVLHIGVHDTPVGHPLPVHAVNVPAQRAAVALVNRTDGALIASYTPSPV